MKQLCCAAWCSLKVCQCLSMCTSRPENEACQYGNHGQGSAGLDWAWQGTAGLAGQGGAIAGSAGHRRVSQCLTGHSRLSTAQQDMPGRSMAWHSKLSMARQGTAEHSMHSSVTTAMHNRTTSQEEGWWDSPGQGRAAAAGSYICEAGGHSMSPESKQGRTSCPKE